MDIVRALRLVALRNVLIPDKADEDYGIRRIMRWYSKTFHTPLHVVEDLPLDDILLAYWEEHYEELSDAELYQHKEDLFTTEEQRRQARKKVDLADADADDFARMVAEEEQQKAEKKTEQKAQSLPQKPVEQRIPEATLPSDFELPPDMHFEFGSIEEISEEELEHQFNTMNQQPEKK